MSTAAAPPRRGHTWRWVVLAMVVIAAVALIGAYLTAPRPGGRMDPGSTGPDGAHALVELLRGQGVDVVEANTVEHVERLARPDSLLLITQTFYLPDDDLLSRLGAAPGDRLVIEPTARTRDVLTPGIRLSSDTPFGEPNCVLREANRAGNVQFGPTDTYQADNSDLEVTRCYDGAVMRYRDDGRTITVVGTADFMTNSTLLREGNAALAMNLAGSNARVVWYAPQRLEGQSSSSATVFDLIPPQVNWIVWQLCLVVALLAIWQGRRLGPLVAEKLPVVVRASETVEGRGRLYRSRRARDSAAQALRTATIQRLLPRLGLGVSAAAPAVVSTVAARIGAAAEYVHITLFGPPPATDADLVHLAGALDDIERQVAHS